LKDSLRQWLTLPVGAAQIFAGVLLSELFQYTFLFITQLDGTKYSALLLRSDGDVRTAVLASLRHFPHFSIVNLTNPYC
jgi:hypothetical protein